MSLGGSPQRSSQKHQVLDQKLAGVTQDWETIFQVNRVWRGEEKADGEQESGDGP
jgi:hypothetical protein